MYVLGIDAGGTKTHGMIATENGQIIGEGFSGCGNYQNCGIEAAKVSLQEAIDRACVCAGISHNSISYAVFGMAGADLWEDFQVLIPAVKSIMQEIPFKIVHDSWIGFAAAVPEHVGIVSICGTGAGHGGCNHAGERLTLRNLDYLTGNLGGGSELVEKALHYAFRSNEGTYEKSLLEDRIPAVFGMRTLDEVCVFIKHHGMTKEQEYSIPILVFELAQRGDAVCKKLISDMGFEEGRYAAAVIRRLHMEHEKFPVVLIGSLFATGESLLIDAYMQQVYKEAELAYPVILKTAPVKGAITLALEGLHEIKK